MRSSVHLTDRLTNADRRLGSATDYVPVRVHLADGRTAVALMTDSPFLEGIARAESNPEDVARAVAIEALRAEQGRRRDPWRWSQWFRRELLPALLLGVVVFVVIVLWPVPA